MGLSGLGAFLGLLFPLALEIAVVGFALLFTGVLLTAPEADSSRPLIRRWWQPLAFSALIFLIGLGLGFLSATVGGILILIACLWCLATVVLAWPASERDRDRPDSAT